MNNPQREPTEREERVNLIRLILLDHRDCLTAEGFHQTPWGEFVGKMSMIHGVSVDEIMLLYPREEYETRARLILALDELLGWIDEGGLS